MAGGASLLLLLRPCTIAIDSESAVMSQGCGELTGTGWFHDPDAERKNLVPGGTLWAFRLRAGRDSDCRVQPRQTDAVDQFVAREANGYKAEGFTRDRACLYQ